MTPYPRQKREKNVGQKQVVYYVGPIYGKKEKILTMAKYIKKPLTVDAVPYKEGMEHGFDSTKIKVACDCICHKPGMTARHIVACCNNGFKTKSIQAPYFDTKQGRVFTKPGDMIITQEDGEQYPCDIANFNLCYLPAINPTQVTNPSTNFMKR